MKKTIIILLTISALVGCSKLEHDPETQAPKVETQKDTTKTQPKKGLNIIHMNPAPIYA